MLKAFCYSGGFTLAALAGGAKLVLSIDRSAEPLAMARGNLALNPVLDAGRAEWRDAALFQKVVAGAALDAKADAAIVARMGASAEHPVALNFLEGEYLKGLLVLKR